MELPIEPRKVLALTRRDIFKWASYKSQFFTTIVGGLIGVATWGFNSTYVNRPVPDYNTDYVSFLITGILVANLVLPLGQGLQNRVNPWTLENILMTGLSTPTFVLGTVLWSYLLSVLLFIPELIIGVYVFGAVLYINIVSLIIAILISSMIVFSLAIISTGFRIVTKINDPVTYSLAIGASLLSGMTFPVSHLNNYIPGLSTVSWFLPQTWIYHIVRLATLEDGSLLQPFVAESFIVAALIGLFLLPVSMYLFRWSLRRAKQDGTLGHY